MKELKEVLDLFLGTGLFLFLIWVMINQIKNFHYKHLVMSTKYTLLDDTK